MLCGTTRCGSSISCCRLAFLFVSSLFIWQMIEHADFNGYQDLAAGVEIKALRAQLEQTTAEIRSELDETKSELAETKSELKETKSQLAEMASKLNETKSELVDVKAEVTQMKAANEGLQTELDFLKELVAQEHPAKSDPTCKFCLFLLIAYR